MTEPRTAAGRALLGNDIRTPAEGGTSPGYRKLSRAILAIEATQAEHDRALDACARMVIVEKAKARAAALHEARAAVRNVRRSRLVGSPGNRHLESGAEGHLLDLTEALAAIDALREDAGAS